VQSAGLFGHTPRDVDDVALGVDFDPQLLGKPLKPGVETNTEGLSNANSTLTSPLRIRAWIFDHSGEPTG
jgi:hypothetical protein